MPIFLFFFPRKRWKISSFFLSRAFLFGCGVKIHLCFLGSRRRGKNSTFICQLFAEGGRGSCFLRLGPLLASASEIMGLRI
ncbi:hypothetical protein NL676_016702 [Syzygium grande]|nr:hypothetical protein NL676_016702 [Syzygium grande]